MKLTRKDFTWSALAFGTGAFTSSLWADMRYDKPKVLDLFRLRSSDTDARVKAGIESNRKGSLLLRFVDEKGHPCERVHVRLRQKTHDFRYGADLFMLDEMPSEELNAAYKARFAEAFNLATLPFYWTGLEPEQGQTRYAAHAPKLYRRPPPDLCLDWCEKNGIEPKAHILNYVTVTPEWAVGDVSREKRLLIKRLPTPSASRALEAWQVSRELLNAQQRLRTLVLVKAVAIEQGADRNDYDDVCAKMACHVERLKAEKRPYAAYYEGKLEGYRADKPCEKDIREAEERARASLSALGAERVSSDVVVSKVGVL